MEKILKILKDIQPETDFLSSNNLIEDGILDSFDLITLISEINFEFGVSVPAHEVKPENFSSVNAIISLINRLVDEK